MTDILQTSIPYDPLANTVLPGIAPLDPDDWLIVDDAYGAQMAAREALLDEQRFAVLAMAPSAMAAARELLDEILSVLAGRGDFTVSKEYVTCPDGRKVPLLCDDPLGTIGRLVQQDFCLLEKPEGVDEHVLTGAVLCFPASWMLSEKFLRPLVGIHVPVDAYDDNIARRVQRLFDGVRPGRPLWRKNALWYRDATLFQPRSEHVRRAEVAAAEGDFLRSERQSLMRLPKTGAVVFGIHTFVLRRRDVEALGLGKES